MAEGDDGGGGGGDGDVWSKGLPEKVQEWDEVKNSDTSDKFWDQVTNMRQFLGQSIRIPGEEASDADKLAFHDKLQSKVPGLISTPDYKDAEATGKFYNALGRPEKHEEYKMPTIDDKGVELDSKPAEQFMPIAHKHGLTQAQFEGIITDMSGNNVELAVAAGVKQQEGVTLLKNEWGLAYEKNFNRIANVVKNTGAPVALQDAIVTGNIDPESAKWLLGIANSFKGESSNLIDDKSNDNVLTPVQARAEISEIRNNQDHDYWHAERPGNADAKKHMSALYKMLEPSDAGQYGSAGVGGVTFQ